jgi:hypothetical protein
LLLAPQVCFSYRRRLAGDFAVAFVAPLFRAAGFTFFLFAFALFEILNFQFEISRRSVPPRVATMTPLSSWVFLLAKLI